MDKIEKAESEEEVKVAMLENANKAGEIKDVDQKAAKKSQFTSKPCKGSETTQKIEYVRANKGLITTVVISAIIIFAVVIAMLATRENKGHSHSKAHNITKMP